MQHPPVTPDVAPPARDAGGPPELDATPGIAEELASGLVLYFRFDEAPVETQFRDLSGKGNHGVLTGLDPATSLAEGRFGGAFWHPGDSEVGVRVDPSPSLDAVSRFTIAAWVWLDRVPDFHGSVLSRQEGTAAYEVYNLAVAADQPVLYVRTTQLSQGVFSAVTLPPGRWAHLVGTYDGTTSRIFVDGTMRAQLRVNHPLIANRHPVYIGTNLNGGGSTESWIGRLDEVVMYDKVLSAQAIAALAAGVRPPAR
jgi:hypothetical protein